MAAVTLEDIKREDRRERLDPLDALGVDWSDLGKNVFGGVHLAGKTVLNVFGMGQLGQSLEEMESKAGILPDWAAGQLAAPAGTTVVSPDHVAVIKQGASGLLARGFSDIARVTVTGGRRFPGNGYRSGDRLGTTFSFGYEGPVSVEMVDRQGRKAGMNDVRQILFLGGIEPGGGPQGGYQQGGPYGQGGQGGGGFGGLMGDDAVGFEWWEGLLAVVSPGSMISTIVREAGSGGGPGGAGKSANFVERDTARLAAAKAGREAAQARLKASKARVAWKPTYTASPSAFTPYSGGAKIDIPSFDFNLDFGGMTDMDNVIGDIERDFGWTELAGEPYVVGTDVLIGVASPPPAKKTLYGAVVRDTGKKTSLNTARPRVQKVKAAVGRAAVALKAGVGVLKLASGQKSVAKRPSPAKRRIGKAGTRVVGDDGFDEMLDPGNQWVDRGDQWDEILGADDDANYEIAGDVPVPKNLTPRQKAAVSKWERSKKKSEEKAKKLADVGKRTIAQTKKTITAVREQAKALRAIRARSAKPTRVHGDDALGALMSTRICPCPNCGKPIKLARGPYIGPIEIHGAGGPGDKGCACPWCGADIGLRFLGMPPSLPKAPRKRPSLPPIEIHGDDGWESEADQWDELIGQDDSVGPESFEDPFTGEVVDTGLPPEVPPLISFKRADKPQEYDFFGVSIMPTNAVSYDPVGTGKGTPPGYIGSAAYFYNTAVRGDDHYGLVYGGSRSQSQWPGEDPNKWIHVHGHKGGMNWWDNAGGDAGLMPDQAVAVSVEKNYGPIIGNPAKPEFAGLKMDKAGNLFWLKEEAPTWATAEADNKAALVEAETKRLEAEAAAAEQARKDAENAAHEEAKHKQDMEFELTQREAEAGQKLAATQQATSDIATTAEQAANEKKIEQQQKAMEQAAQAAELKIAAQQAALDAQAQQAELDWVKRQAEIYQKADEAQTGRGGGGGEQYDDGSGYPDPFGGGGYAQLQPRDWGSPPDAAFAEGFRGFDRGGFAPSAAEMSEMTDQSNIDWGDWGGGVEEGGGGGDQEGGGEEAW